MIRDRKDSMGMKASIPISGATKQEKQSKRLAYK
jgi:hypothetical protein